MPFLRCAKKLDRATAPAYSTHTMTIEIKNLALRRGARWLCAGLCLSLAAGSTTVLRGPNGSGKSSFLRAVGGFLPLVEGQILYRDQPLVLQGPERGLNGCWYSHKDGLAAELSAGRSLQLTAALHGRNDELDAVLAADDFAIASFLDCEIRSLSTGQRQRVALSVFCLCTGPDYLWLMDEPDSGLDRQGRAALEALLARQQRAGGYCLLASHSAFSNSFSHRVIDSGQWI